jgi:hypothetical protein
MEVLARTDRIMVRGAKPSRAGRFEERGNPVEWQVVNFVS